VEVKRTEILRNCLDPEFATKTTIAYHFEETQKMKFELYDIDSSSRRLSEHDFLGGCQISLGQIVAAGSITLPLENPEHGEKR